MCGLQLLQRVSRRARAAISCFSNFFQRSDDEVESRLDHCGADHRKFCARVQFIYGNAHEICAPVVAAGADRGGSCACQALWPPGSPAPATAQTSRASLGVVRAVTLQGEEVAF